MQIKNERIIHMIRFTNHYFGWRNWSVLVYNSVLENMFVLFYIALRNQLYSVYFIVDFFFFILFSVFSTTYGYLVNDLADKELDNLHGKDNTFKDDSRLKASLIVILFLVLSIIFGLHFTRNPFFLPFWLCWAFIATFYSLKPIRLKEKGKSGLIFVVLAQRVLPTLLIFSAFQHYKWVDVIFFTAYIFFRGFSSDLNHQLEDYHKDSVTGIDTYAVQSGLQKAQKIFRLSLEIEKGLLIFCLLIMYLRLPYLQICGISFILPVLLVYLLLYGLNLFKIKSQGMKIDVNPFVPGRKDVFQFIHHTFPSVMLPFYILLFLMYKSKIFVILFVFLFIYRKLYSVELIRSSFPFQLIRNFARRF